MSELIQKHDNRATIRWKLLTSASALALGICASHPDAARAEDARPLVWIDLGASLDMLGGIDERFDAPFMHITPTPEPYKGGSPFDLQRPMRFSIDGDFGLTFQPAGSDWVLSAGIKYGRSHKRLDRHHQTDIVHRYPAPLYAYYHAYYPSYNYQPYLTHTAPAAQFADTNINHTERHLIVDFQAGKDVGLGMFGHDGTSVISGGVRMARFSTHDTVNIRARPTVFVSPTHFLLGYVFPYEKTKFSSYYLTGKSSRGFHGIGPSVSWKASVPIAGTLNDGQLSLDIGINGAVLFGRQTAKTSHHMTSYYRQYAKFKYHDYSPSRHPSSPQNRSRNVTVPNIGGFAGLSYRYTDAKISIGYRYDTFLSAMDMGIDVAKKSNVTFNGPYASISIGIGD